MSLSPDLVSQFVKITNDNKKQDTKKENITYGTVQKVNGDEAYIKLDGSKPRYYAVTYDAEKYILTSNIIEYPTNHVVTEKVDKVLDRTKTELDVNSYVVGEETKYFATVTDDQLLPATTTVAVNVGDRVIVMIKNHSAVITGNLGNPATTTEYVDGETGKIQEIANNANNKANEANNKVAEFTVAITERLDTKELTATWGDISHLTTGELLAEVINVNTGKVKTLDTEMAKIDTAKISNLSTDVANIEKALIKELNAETGDVKYAKIEELETGVADINKLMFGSATGDTIHTDFSNSVIAQVGDAQIKSAMIKDIDAGKIQSGSIDTNKVNIQSDDGSFVIKDNRLQIKEGDTVRVQIGKDGTGNYSVSICDKEGKVVFSENGVTGDGIPDNVIVNDMVAYDANIHASKLDIDSLFEEINSDGTNVIKSTKITVDEQGQTLEAAFKKMATTESVDNLSKTVSSQASQIQANTQAISTKVWQQDINTAKNEMTTQYSTLSQDVNGFKTTVSNTYTTKADFNNLSIGGRNIILNSSFNHDGANWSLNTGPMHSYAFNDDDFAGNKSFEWHVTGRTGYGWIGMSQHFPIGRFKDGGKFILSGWAYVFSDEEVTGGASIELNKIDTSDVTSGCGAVNLVDEGNPKDEWFYFEKMYTIPVSDLKEYFVFPWIGINGHIKISQLKLEFGTKATDWTPAPEDMAASEDVAHAQTTADEATARITTAETLIQQLSDSISMLVTDGNGTSLMTQTDDGWVFSTADIQNTVNRISENLSTLTDDVGNVDNTVSVLQQAVDDLGILGEYIQITTYEDEPCIELGELDSDFKLRITNTRMMFTEGSVVLAYFTNQSFHSKKVVVEEELQQGGFVWKARANGNLGLVWKGGNS